VLRSVKGKKMKKTKYGIESWKDNKLRCALPELGTTRDEGTTWEGKEGN